MNKVEFIYFQSLQYIYIHIDKLFFFFYVYIYKENKNKNINNKKKILISIIFTSSPIKANKDLSRNKFAILKI